jgi:hypothetical protein
MIDKVELRVPHFVPYTGDFSQLYRELRNDPKGPFKHSAHYLAVADLRDYGYPVILHTHNVHDKCGNFKLELIETGGMTYSGMARQVARVFAVDVGRLELMRLDLAADVESVPVSWFERNYRAKFKRWTSSIGKLEDPGEFSEMGRRGVETFYLGKRPNVIRVYNKVAERQYQHNRMAARAKRAGIPASEVPTFEAIFSHPPTGFTLTRVERQMAGGRVPETLTDFSKLRNASDFKPFEPLVYIGVGKPEPNPDNYDFNEYGVGMYLRELVEREGFHRARQIVNQHSKRNASRIFKRYAEFMPADGCFISTEGLNKRYQESVSKQLAA